MTEPVPPPHNIEAEESLLGAIMLSRDAIRAAALLELTAGDFYKPAHGHIYTAALALHERGAPIDPVTLIAELGGHAPEGIDRGALMRLQAATPASANAPHYAEIVAEHARQRSLMVAASDLTETARGGGDVSRLLELITQISTPRRAHEWIIAGDAFLRHAYPPIEAVWGHDQRVLWAPGEVLFLVGPPGVGKTTIAHQLVAARLGIGDTTLLELPVSQARKILYLACDRPAQISRALTRLIGPEHDELLRERLIVGNGPPPSDLARHPEFLERLALENGVDCVFIDSLKDVALAGLSDEETAAGINSAMQRCIRSGIDVCSLHHQRKAEKGGAKPKSLADVYGNMQLTAGVGSVVLLWGEAGDASVDLIHLKQPAEVVGPYTVIHDHHSGLSHLADDDAIRGDPILAVKKWGATKGITALEYARFKYRTDSPSRSQKETARTMLKRRVAEGRLQSVKKSDEESDRYFLPAEDEQQQLTTDAGSQVQNRFEPDHIDLVDEGAAEQSFL